MSTAAQTTNTHVELDAHGGVRFLAGMSQDQSYPSLDAARQAVTDQMTRQAVESGGPVRLRITDPDGNWRLLVHPDGTLGADDSPADEQDEPAEQHDKVPWKDPEEEDEWPVQESTEPAPERETDPIITPAREAAASDPEPEPTAEAEVRPAAAPEPVADDAPARRVVRDTSAPWEPVRMTTDPAVAAPVARTHESFISREVAPRPAENGWRGALNRLGLRLAPDARELAERADVRLASQHWVGARTVVVVNAKGGAGKTPTAAMLSAVLGRCGGGGVLAWDVNQLRGTLGWRTEQGDHDATVLDVVPNLHELASAEGSLSDLAEYVHHQSEDRYDVLRSQPLVLANEQRLQPWVVDDVWRVMTRYYRMVVADTGNDESDPMWRSIVGHADQLVVATTTGADRAEAGLLLLEALAQDERTRELANNAVVVVTQADPRATSKDVATIVDGFKSVAREVVHVPHDAGLVDGQLRWSRLRPATQRAWLALGAAVARGL